MPQAIWWNKITIFCYQFLFFSFSAGTGTDTCPLPSGPNYRKFNSKCYYFESSVKSYNSAQSACSSRFGSHGGKLVEPSASTELYAYLYSTANSIGISGRIWIGIDDLYNNNGVFLYATTHQGRSKALDRLLGWI